MNQIGGMVLFNQPVKTFKPLVTGVFRILDMARRRMGNHHVHTSPPPECRSKPTYDGTHSPFLVLDGAAIVPARPLQPEKVYPFEFYQPAVQVVTACRRLLVITYIMVAAHIIKWGLKKIDQTGKVFRRKVATGKNQVDILKRVGIGLLEKSRFYHIRDRQNFQIICGFQVFAPGVFTIPFLPVRNPNCIVISKDSFLKYSIVPKIFEKRLPPLGLNLIAETRKTQLQNERHA